ncbi:ABC transporter permease [Microbacterium saperdae]|uniref:ABC-type transport system involved in multi-copper enzyme maturation permease subunit n=1 Tax=Microbacterium saperdae TaxID=69368 RepID=A0A543BQF4_9MICO|nr:ABC transporter permease [Microbacterium saperdae]TQL87065.1 ABC-type transport system involved in multi-copper enzyme maturation permease subunit [Microbacterium saperdae]GGM43178.1 ABC transporter permease [Microbacterium saperdae]
MNFSHIITIARLELTQRLRSVGWYILLGVYAAVLLGVTVLAYAVYSWDDFGGAGVFSIVVNMVLLLVVLVSPTLSGNTINGDRDAATLAAIQVTAASTGDIMIGKLLAAVATGGAFLVVAIPFLAGSLVGGAADVSVLLVSLLVLIVEIIVVAAIGVGLSGLIARPLFSVATTYLVVAGLVIGTLITFALGGLAVRSEATSYSRPYDSAGNVDCERWDSYSYEVPRFDLVWWTLAANPFVVLADATPTEFSKGGNPIDLFGQIKLGVRMVQLSPLEQRWDECAQEDTSLTGREIIDSTVPSWFVGLGVQVVLAGSLFAGAWTRTRTPARRLPPGTRIA